MEGLEKFKGKSWLPILLIILSLFTLALIFPDVNAIDLQTTTLDDWFELEKTPVKWECLEWGGVPGESECVNQIATEYTFDKKCLGKEWDWKDPMPFETVFNKVGGFNHYKYCINEIILKNPTTDFISTTDFIYRLSDMGTGGKEVQFLVEDPITPNQLILWDEKYTKAWDVGLSTKIYAYGEKYNIGDTIEWDFELTYKPENLTYYKDPFWDGSGGENASAVLVVDGLFHYDRAESYADGAYLDNSNSPYYNLTYDDVTVGNLIRVVTDVGNQVFISNSSGNSLAEIMMLNTTDFGYNYTVRGKIKGQDSIYSIKWRAEVTEDGKYTNGYAIRKAGATGWNIREILNATSTKRWGGITHHNIDAGSWIIYQMEMRVNTSLFSFTEKLGSFNETTLTLNNITGQSSKKGVGFTTSASALNNTQASFDNFIVYQIADGDYLDTEIQNISMVALYSDAEGDPWDSRTCFWDFNSDTVIDYTHVISSPSDTNYNCTVNSDSWSAGTFTVYVQDCDDGGDCDNVTNENVFTLSISNQPPVMDNVNISSLYGRNTSGENLFGGFNWSDPDADTWTNETLWWKDGSIIAALNDLQEISASNTSAAEVWIFSARVNDGTVWSGWKNSTNMTINTPPTHDTPIINASNIDNRSNRNLTVWNITTADVDDHSVKNIINWYKNGGSITVLNMPFEGGSLDGNASGVPNAAKDYSPYGNNGTVIGAVWDASGGYDNKGSYMFDSVDDKIDYGSDSSLDITSAVTVAAWFNLDNASQGNIINKYGAYILSTNMQGWIQFTVWLSSSNATYTVMNNTASFISGWHFLTGTYDGSALKLYLDGVLQKTETNSTYPGLSGSIGTSSNSIFSGGSEGTCPDNMAYINKLGGYCIDKYEATAWNADATFNESSNTTSWRNTGDPSTANLLTGGGYANSSAGYYPWVYIKQAEARTACEAHPAGNKYLCTSEEWLAAANIKGQIYNLPTTITDCNVVSGQPAECTNLGPNSGDACVSGHMADCVSSEGIYDMTGNVWERTNESLDLVINPTGTSTPGTGTADQYYINSTSMDWSTSTAASAKYGNDATYFPTTTANRVVIRGGYWTHESLAGPFCAILSDEADFTNLGLGFRCCATPS